MSRVLKIVTHRPDLQPGQPTSSIRLGDVVAAVAQPIAKAIDRVAGTNIANCGGCKKRREFLNKLTS